MRKSVTVQAKKYQKQLDEEVEADRQRHHKKPLKKEEKEIVQSTTDPECGMLHKGEHEKQFACLVNTVCDIHNFILDFVVNAI